VPTPISNRKERTGFLLPGSLRLGFLGHRSFTTAAPSLASRSGPGLAPNPGPFRDPENIQCRAVFIQYLRAVVPRAAGGAPGVQHFIDSRHGRIACKAFSRRFKRTESRRFQSVLWLVGQHLPWLAAALKKSVRLHCSISAERRRFQSVNRAQGPTPLAGWRQRSQLHFFFAASSGNIRLAS
jgi:hypothetical protein